MMISEERRITFVWRCSACPAVYDGDTLALLLDDGTLRVCSCGGRLVEGVGTVPEYGDEFEATPRRSSVVFLRGV